MTAMQTAVLLPTKSSLVDDFEFGHAFGAKAPLPLTSALQQYLTIIPGFVGLLFLCGNNISMVMQLGFFYP